LTVVGLDAAGGTLNTKTKTQSSYELSGIPSSTSFHLRVWNQGGAGRTVTHRRVQSDASGSLPITSPLHSVFAITSIG
jgi:hypothetical protein